MKLTFKKYLLETALTTKAKRIDEFDKKIVFEDNDYMIVVNNLTHARFVTLWDKSKTPPKKVGALSAYNMSPKSMKIEYIEIDKKHQNKGYGTKMYKALLNHMDEDLLKSYLPDRSNKSQVPSIYKKLKGTQSGDYATIHKGKKIHKY